MTLPLCRIISALALIIALVASCAAAEVEELSIDNNGRAIAVTRYAADGANPRPAVLVLHGPGGIEVGAEQTGGFLGKCDEGNT
jgi:hypothetical protein